MLHTAKASDTVVLLDDQLAPGAQARSRVYKGLRQCLVITDPNSLAAALQAMQEALEQGLFAVLTLDYELGEQLQGVSHRSHLSPTSAWSQILLFDECLHLNPLQVDAWLDNEIRARQAHTPVLTGWQPNVTPTEFEQAVLKVQQKVETGDTYQVNLCFSVSTTLNGDPVALYRTLRQHQQVAYGALIGLPDGRWILSRSPELFLSSSNGWLEARPMKGTADARGSFNLAQDPKNRAENVMIVDLLRNDLGRIAEPGSVSVPERFNVQRFGDVLQMTSTVRAKALAGLSWIDLLTAVFPCGSITGAPKHSTMQIIRELEKNPRGLYTGAIGWIDPSQGQSTNDFCWNVPIRTLTLSSGSHSQPYTVELGVGAGITYDSLAADEWAECALKVRFLSQWVNDARLFETMRARRDSGVAHLQQHLARLSASAASLGYSLDINHVRDALQLACAKLTPDIDHRLRLELHVDGQIHLTSGPLDQLQTPVQVLLAQENTQSNDFLLRHKTTDRARYDAAWQHAVSLGAFDMLFFNERDELTEGGRTNVFIKLDGNWYTPPIEAGVLPGIMRGVLLADPAMSASVRTISREDLMRADDVLICNALRGGLIAQLVTQ